MKTLWMTSLRPFGISTSNDLIQENFINSIISLQSNIEFSFTQFDELGVQDFVRFKKNNKILFQYCKKFSST